MHACKEICSARWVRTCGPSGSVRRGMSQEDFAEFLGVHRTYMGGVERGERNLTLRSVEKLAERLDVDPVSLLRPPPS